MYQFKNIVIPLGGSSYPFKKSYCNPFERPAGAIRSKTIANFLNCSSQSVEKQHKPLFVKKNLQPFELCASRSTEKTYQPPEVSY